MCFGYTSECRKLRGFLTQFFYSRLKTSCSDGWIHGGPRGCFFRPSMACYFGAWEPIMLQWRAVPAHPGLLPCCATGQNGRPAQWTPLYWTPRVCLQHNPIFRVCFTQPFNQSVIPSPNAAFWSISLVKVLFQSRFPVQSFILQTLRFGRSLCSRYCSNLYSQFNQLTYRLYTIV